MSHFIEEGRNNFILNSNSNNVRNEINNNNNKLIKEIKEINNININKILYFIDPITELIFQSIVHNSNSNSSNDDNNDKNWSLLGNISLYHSHNNNSNNNNNRNNDDKGEKKQIISEIYINKLNNILIIKNIQSISDSLIHEWVNLVTFENIQEIMIFDGIYISKFNHNHNDRLRVLFSSQVLNEDKQIYNHIQTLETGNIVENASAALICYSEFHSLKAVLCLAIRESSYSQEAAQAYLQLENQLKNFLQIDHIQFLDSKIHKKMIRHDPFISRTSNMFI